MNLCPFSLKTFHKRCVSSLEKRDNEIVYWTKSRNEHGIVWPSTKLIGAWMYNLWRLYTVLGILISSKSHWDVLCRHKYPRMVFISLDNMVDDLAFLRVTSGKGRFNVIENLHHIAVNGGFQNENVFHVRGTSVFALVTPPVSSPQRNSQRQCLENG